MLKNYIGQYFESASYTTPEFKSFARQLKKELKQELNATPIEFANVYNGHFEVGGFVHNTETDKYAYFKVGDVRPEFTGNGILVRTADSDHDYTGGTNNFCDIDNLANELERLTR